MDSAIVVRVAIRRFAELMLTCIIISVLITFLHVAEVLVTNITLCIGLSTGFLLYLVENIRMMRGCYRDMEKDMEYAIANISAYILYAAVMLGVYRWASNECFVWMFSVTKFVKYINPDVDTFASMLIFHAISFLTIFVAPAGMSHLCDEIEFFEDNIDPDEEI